MYRRNQRVGIPCWYAIASPLTQVPDKADNDDLIFDWQRLRKSRPELLEDPLRPRPVLAGVTAGEAHRHSNRTATLP